MGKCPCNAMTNYIPTPAPDYIRLSFRSTQLRAAKSPIRDLHTYCCALPSLCCRALSESMQ